MNTEINKELVKAVQENSLESVKNLINKGASANTADEIFGMPVLITAAKGNLEIVKYLIEKGADINITDSQGETALTWALEKKQTEIIDFLLEMGANADIVGKRFKKKDVLAEELFNAVNAGHVERVIKALEKGAHVNSGNGANYGNTPLHYAARNGYLEIAEILIGKGADVNLKTLYSPLYEAIYYKHDQIVSLLFSSGAKMNPSESLVGFANSDILRILLNNGANQEDVLLRSLDIRDFALAEEVISSGAEIDLQCLNVVLLSEEELDFLQKRGFDLNQKNQKPGLEERTLLHWAVIDRDEDRIKMLLQRGADPTITDQSGKTPVDYIVGKKFREIFASFGIDSKNKKKK